MNSQAAAKGPTLVQFFRLEDRRVEQNCIEKLAAGGASAILRGLIERTPGLPLDAAAGSIIRALRSALDTPLTHILAGGWSKRLDLLAFCDRSKYPPDRVIDYALVGTDKIDYTYEPQVQLIANGVDLEPTLRFEINVKLRIRGAVLRIQDAHIVGAHVGSVQGRGSVGCAGAVLAAPASEEVTFPAELAFEPPLAITRPSVETPPPAEAASADRSQPSLSYDGE
jgi:hypothetical protein